MNNNDAGWAFATAGRKAHWFTAAGPLSACQKYYQAPHTSRRPDSGTKLVDNCAACDKVVQVAVRDAVPEVTPRDLARRSLGEHAILAEAGRLARETDALLAAALGKGGRLTFGDDEGDLGMVYTTNPTGTHKVTDPRAYLAWVRTHRPHAIVEAVDPMFTKAVLAEGCTSDGEVPDGVELIVGAPVLTVKVGAGARAAARSLVAPIMPEVSR